MEKEKGGVWRTIRGRRIFIASGQSLGEAMTKSGKFNRSDIREGKREASLEDRIKKSRNIAKKTNEKNYENSIRKLEKNEHKYASKYDYRDSDFKNQDRKNIINENENIINRGARRIDRNAMRYSKRDEQELRQEELKKQLENYKKVNYDYSLADQSLKDVEKAKKELVDFKAKKQSNNKQETYEEYKNRLLNDDNYLQANRPNEYFRKTLKEQSNNQDSFRNMTPEKAKVNLENAQKESAKAQADWDEKIKNLNNQETIKNYVEKKKSNNHDTTNRILERSGKVNQKTLKSYADDGLATDITRYSDKDIDKLEKKHGRLTHLKTSMGTYGMNGALLKSEKTGEYFVITARNSTLFRIV